MADFAVRVIRPPEFEGVGEIGPFAADMFTCRYLAQGDSWFSIGSIPPGLTSNLLDNLVLSRSAFVVNCAFPGAKLQRMTETTRNVQFLRLLTGTMAVKWDAILLSGGGNDLIEAAGSDPGQPANLRLLATAAERGSGPIQPDAYISNAGWKTFSDHLTAVFEQLVQARDSGMNRGVPLLFHTYAPLMPRPAPAGLGFGPWLAPALSRFGVPSSDWLGVAQALIDRLHGLLQALVDAHTQRDPDCALQLIDTRNAGLVMAQADSSGVSGDFQNEIHLTNAGYAKLGKVWRQTLDALDA